MSHLIIKELLFGPGTAQATQPVHNQNIKKVEEIFLYISELYELCSEYPRHRPYLVHHVG